MLGEYDNNRLDSDGRLSYGDGDFGGNLYPPRSAEPPVPSRDPYVAFALRWWWLLLIGSFLGTAAAFAYTRYGPIPYETTAMVQVPTSSPTDPTAGSGRAEAATESYAAEASSSRMLGLVSQALGEKVGLSASELSVMMDAEQIAVEPVGGVNLIEISVTDPDKGRAQLLANTFATVFVKDVNDRAKARLDERKKQLEQQIDFTRERLSTAQLQQREQDLKSELADERMLLLQSQLNYQQELQRRAEQAPVSNPKRTGQPAQPSGNLEQVQSEWIKVVTAQIKDIQGNIAELTEQLGQVRAALRRSPSNSDGTVSAAFASAYDAQLQDATQAYVQMQLDSQTAMNPLVRYGVASDPLPASGGKKMLLMGFGCGTAAAAGLGFLIEFIRRRRQRTSGAALRETDLPEALSETRDFDLLRRLDQLGLLDAAPTRPGVGR